MAYTKKHGSLIWLVGLFVALLVVVCPDLSAAETVNVDKQIAIGYFIHISADPIVLKQDLSSESPFSTFTGCTTVQVISSFAARLSVRVRPTSVAGGHWTASIRPATLPQGQSKTKVCVTGQGLDVTVMEARSRVKVAEVTIIVMPN